MTSLSGGSRKLLASMTGGGGTLRVLSERSGVPYPRAAAYLSYLAETGKITYIGCAGDALAAGRREMVLCPGRRHYRVDAKVWALPGTPRLPAASWRAHAAHSEASPPKSRCGSGHVAGPILIGKGFRWFTGGITRGQGRGAE